MKCLFLSLALFTVAAGGGKVLPQGEQNRIVNGNDVQYDRYPYIATLQSVFRHECGGTVIAPDIVLTAAHCVDNYLFEVWVGRPSLSDSTSERFAILETWTHPNYGSNYDAYDVALLKLHGPSTVPPVRLNRRPLVPADGDSLTVMGWGDDGTGYFPDVLQEVDVKYIPNKICKDAGAGDPNTSYEPWLTPDMMCAVENEKDACAGDSGGPLIVKGATPEDDIQVGIVSWGIFCAVYPGVYARVSSEIGWIENVVCARSTNPPAAFGCGRPPPTLTPTLTPTSQPTTRPTLAPTPAPTVQTTDPPRITAAPSPMPVPPPTLTPATTEPTSTSPTTAPQSTSPTDIDRDDSILPSTEAPTLEPPRGSHSPSGAPSGPEIVDTSEQNEFSSACNRCNDAMWIFTFVILLEMLWF